MNFYLDIDFLKDYLLLKETADKSVLRFEDFQFDKIRRLNNAIFNRKVRYLNLPTVRPEELKDFVMRISYGNLSKFISQIKSTEQKSCLFLYEFVSNTIDTKTTRKETRKLVFKLDDLLNDSINEKLFIHTPYNIREELKSWSSLYEKTMSFKFLVINDSFIFLNNKMAVFEMIGALIKRMEYDAKGIIINTALDSFGYPKGLKNSEDHKKVLDQISSTYNELKEKFPDTNFLLTVNKYHKRLFFTNNQYFDSDQSFSNYFKPNEKLICYPHIGYSESKKQLFFYTNFSYSIDVLKKAFSANYFEGDKEIAKYIIEYYNDLNSR
jgi:hypothetical protein